MADEFQWNSENEDVVQHSVQGVAAYVNAGNLISVRQERAWDEDEDKIIVLTIEGAWQLSDRLRELITSYQM